MHDHGRYTLLGQTVDDAAGEAFDKVGRLLDLPYPGGPAISAAARGATPVTRFPRARTDGAYDFSFSGLKTAVLREVQGYRDRGEPIPVDGIAAAFEEAVVDALASKTLQAARDHGVALVALGGGVAANRALRATLGDRLAADGLSLRVPPPAWCTDNGAMIGAAAAHRLAAGDRADATLEAIPNLSLSWLDGA
jgi:N6-L-threonylcarbamoyladenine synthase